MWDSFGSWWNRSIGIETSFIEKVEGKIKEKRIYFAVTNGSLHGFKIQAVKIYYDCHPELDLKDSKEVIDKIEEEIKQSENWFNICIRMKFPF